MILFETDKKPLTFLLDQIDNRELALPDFQRSFVWEPGATRELVVSVMSSFPAGTLLLMQGGAEVFAPRAVESAPTLDGSTPSYLILDGQQRMTSLYQAFSGTGTHRFFLNLQELLEGYDLDEAVEVYNVRQASRWEALEGQARGLMLPLAQLRDFNNWIDDVLELRQEYDDVKKLKRALNELETRYVDPVKLYQFPVTSLSQRTPVEAICTIFETLNRTGVKLSVFELLTARAFAEKVNLRTMWEQARAANPILVDFDADPYYVLQVIAVTVSGTSKRSAVISLGVPDVTARWDAAVDGLARSLELLRDECGVLTPKWLGYQTMLVTLGVAWQHVTNATGPATGDRRAKLKRWFWCSSFSGAYENSANTQTEQDTAALERWLNGGNPPAVVSEFTFDARRWQQVSYRNRALYRSTIALMMRRAPLDFHTGQKLDKAVIDGQKVDDHHVFPRAYLRASGQSGPIDSVLNHTLIDRITNIRISKQSPSTYVGEMQDELGHDLTQKILRSHLLPPEVDGPLRRDDFPGFLTWRLERLAEELRDVTGGTVSVGGPELPVPSDDLSEEPYIEPDREELGEHL